ncbi:hypothetical protein ACFLZY_02330 [Patescibacteria group bacterium]
MNHEIRQQVTELRKQGYTYSEIQKEVGILPKSTLSYWCKDIRIPDEILQQKIKRNKEKLKLAREKALKSNENKRDKYLAELVKRTEYFAQTMNNNDVAKIALAMLYLGEGSKNPKRGCVCLGNSDPKVIQIFLDLLRYCYIINESKFRCTIQCRDDQNEDDLMKFWHKITNVPYSQFYQTQKDPRTKGKPSKKPNYKGVCRIDYFCADIFYELMYIIDAISKGARSLVG